MQKIMVYFVEISTK